MFEVCAKSHSVAFKYEKLRVRFVVVSESCNIADTICNKEDCGLT